MTLGALSVFLLVPQCQSDYPEAATLCDEWCSAYDRPRCPNADPAQCVTQCEQLRVREIVRNEPPGRCDPLRRAVIDCVNALPSWMFDCDDTAHDRVDESCHQANIAFAVCETGQTASWTSVCARWAVNCAATSQGDAGDGWNRFYDSCLPPSGVFSCFQEQQVMARCLEDHHDLSCDVLPIDNPACEKERFALDSCHPYQLSLCNTWSAACSRLDVDAGPDSAPHSLDRCIAARPVDTGARCRAERDALYQCFWDKAVIREWRCDVVPLRAPECQAQSDAFTACAQSIDGGAFVR